MDFLLLSLALTTSSWNWPQYRGYKISWKQNKFFSMQKLRIYNMIQVGATLFVPQIQDVLHRAAFESNSQVASIFHTLHATESPPTYFRTNKLTGAFQEIVDAYGIAKYQEANPTVYIIIMFPFLFVVMFGDWGHGLCLLFATLVFICKEKKLGDIMEMALFSIYRGLIYNELFSVPFHIFGPSAYKCRDPSCGNAYKDGMIKYREPYPFGIDSMWRGIRTELPFLNSLKMKMFIVLGVAQMNLGIVLSYFNAKFFSNSLNIWYQFVPQMIFFERSLWLSCSLNYHQVVQWL